MKKIETITSVPPDFQDIMFRGDKLAASLHPLETVKNFEEISVVS